MIAKALCISLHPVAFWDTDTRTAERLDLTGFFAVLSGSLVRWCNGSTEVFGAFSRGSNPRRTANGLSAITAIDRALPQSDSPWRTRRHRQADADICK